MPELLPPPNADGAREEFLFSAGGDGGFVMSNSISFSIVDVVVDVVVVVVEGDEEAIVVDAPVDNEEDGGDLELTTSRVTIASVIVVELLLLLLLPPSAAILNSFTNDCGSNSCTLFQIAAVSKGLCSSSLDSSVSNVVRVPEYLALLDDDEAFVPATINIFRTSSCNDSVMRFLDAAVVDGGRFTTNLDSANAHVEICSRSSLRTDVQSTKNSDEVRVEEHEACQIPLPLIAFT